MELHGTPLGWDCETLSGTVATRGMLALNRFSDLFATGIANLGRAVLLDFAFDDLHSTTC